jgi:hypothetical protein
MLTGSASRGSFTDTSVEVIEADGIPGEGDAGEEGAAAVPAGTGVVEPQPTGKVAIATTAPTVTSFPNSLIAVSS